jgi:hypothetical protein
VRLPQFARHCLLSDPRHPERRRAILHTQLLLMHLRSGEYTPERVRVPIHKASANGEALWCIRESWVLLQEVPVI